VANAALKSERDSLAEALRDARLAEAAHFDAALELRDSKSLRLQLLQDELLPTVRASTEARELFDLTLVPGEPPKLWVDLVSYVVMEPDHRTYRFVQDRQDGREILLESSSREQTAAAIRRHIAHRLVARERVLAAPSQTVMKAGYSTASLILAWASGFAFGALALLAAALYLGIIKH
jgi:hypothetical protein